MKGNSKRKSTVVRRGTAAGTDEKQHGCWERAAKSGSSLSKGTKSGKVGTSPRISSENRPQQPLEMLPASTDSGRKYIKVLKRLPHPDNALGSPAPKFSVTACHECRQIEMAHRWCLRSLNCGSPMEAVVSGSSSAADASVGPKKSRKLIISRPAKSARSSNSNQLSATKPQVSNLLPQPPPVAAANTSAARSPLLASGAVVGPQSQKKQNYGSQPNAPLQPQTYYDPFINLRLDIDNMSYEELLALQEQIGYVSTGLSEEELGKCRKTDVYGVKRRKTAMKKAADAKCSICQEEYRSGDKMGSLKCEHSYHVTCIDEWLRRKNWCPTCKAGAAEELVPA